MRLADYYEAIRINIDDVHADKYSNEQLFSLINRALQKVWRVFMSMEYYPVVKSTTITIESGSQTGSILVDSVPVTVAKVLRATDSYGNKIDIIEEVFATNQCVQPYIFLRGDRKTVGWWEVASEDVTITLHYVPNVTKFPTATSGLNILDIPELHEELVVQAATIMALGSDEDNIAFWKNEYNETLGEIRESLTVKTEHGQVPVDMYGDDYDEFI